MQDAPDISHIIPAFNEAMFLPRTLESVKRAADAFAGTVEIIVVDNNSTDETAATARRHGARVVFESRRLIAAARNAGAANARGRILTFADADSMVSENFFVRAFRHMTEVDRVGGNFGVRTDRTSLGIRLSVGLVLAIIRTGFHVGGGSYFCLRETFEAVGGFDTSLDYGEDVAFARALRRYGNSLGLCYVQDHRAYVVTSMRKADQLGDWFVIKFFLGAPLMALRPSLAKRWLRAHFYEFDRSKPSKGFQ